MSNTNKVFLAAALLRVLYAVGGTLLGRDLPGAGLVSLFFIVAAIIFLFVSFPKLVRRLLWRVRHRLLVTWVFVGVVPIVLISALAAQGLYILMGQFVGHMTTTEISRRADLLRGSAQTLAWNLDHRAPSVSPETIAKAFMTETSAARRTRMGVIARAGKDVAVISDDISEIPKWSTPALSGLVRARDRNYLAAHVTVNDAKEPVEVFLYEVVAEDFFKSLLPDVAGVRLVGAETTVTAAGVDIRRTDEARKGVSVNTGREDPNPSIDATPPAGRRSWWDVAINWLVLVPATDLAKGTNEQLVAAVATRPSLVVKKLFSNLGALAVLPFMLVVITACTLLVVEVISILFGAKLTRSITRAVADLHEGTKKVQSGDLSHRIPVRKTKDQLSELASSFNIMTERIENLITEVKEKQRLENELQIARDVQSQLFPKELPHLKTLELWGGCQPARMVSGDYYDFVSLGLDRAALAIGDISGKGISAALLMAHVQSALRSQLMQRGANGDGLVTMSPASILSILSDHLYTSSSPEKYATFFLGLYADENALLTYTNAGHLAPMLVRSGKVQRLRGEGFPVGMFPGVQYEQQSLCLEPGDLLVAFTDGVTEAPNVSGEEYGDQRLTDLLVRFSEQSLDRVADEITGSLAEWSKDRERHDDTTLLLARRV